MTLVLRYIAVVATVCGGLAGCGGSHKVDARLAHADSLIVDHAERAYTVLKAIDSEELLSESDRAFYALLYTQAQYKNVDSIGSDSLINIALDYYKDNHNREHYTRTLIYKGAVMEELGNPEEALEWYLRAENNAAPDDYLNLGQANLRMSVLYSTHYIGDGLDLEKDRAALHYFRLADNKRYELMCLSSLGGGFRIYNMDSAYYYLDKALELAEEMGNEGEFYSCTEMKVRGMLEDSLHHEAKTLALDYLNTKGTEYVDDDLYYDLANAYIGLGNADSAQYYFNKTIEPVDERKLVSYKWIASLINEMKGEYEQAHNYNKSADSLADKLVYNNTSSKLIRKKQVIYDELLQSGKDKNKTYLLYIFVMAFVIIGCLLFIPGILYKKQSLINKLRTSTTTLIAKTKNSLQEKDETINNIISTYLIVIKQFLESSDKYGKNESLQNQLNDILNNKKPDNAFWNLLYQYVDERYDNLMSNTINANYGLSDKEIKIIAMICCGFAPQEIRLFIGEKNSTYIYKKFKLIAKKMDLTMPLIDFLSQKTSAKQVQ